MSSSSGSTKTPRPPIGDTYSKSCGCCGCDCVGVVWRCAVDVDEGCFLTLRISGGHGGSGLPNPPALRVNDNPNDGDTIGVLGDETEVRGTTSRSSRSSRTTDALESLCFDFRLRFFLLTGVAGCAAAVSSPPLVCSPFSILSFNLLRSICLAAILSPPATVLFLVNLAPPPPPPPPPIPNGGGVGEEDTKLRSKGSPVNFCIAIARAAPALLERNRPLWMSSKLGNIGVGGCVPG